MDRSHKLVASIFHLQKGRFHKVNFLMKWLKLRKGKTLNFTCDLQQHAHQANLQPNLLLLNFRLSFNSTLTFFGVTFDRTLSFSKHVSSLKAKFFPHLKAFHCISASSWGPSKESLSLLYKSFLGLFSLTLHPDGCLS